MILYEFSTALSRELAGSTTATQSVKAMSDSLTFRLLKYIKESAESLNFTRAAETVFVAQSSVSHQIGEIAKLGKQPLNGDKSMVNGAVTFGWFVLHRYSPLKEADWRDETAKVKNHIIQADLIDEFWDVRLENFDKFTLQTHLNKLAKTRSRDRVLQIRAYIKAIFAEAVDQEFLPKDTARTLKTPAGSYIAAAISAPAAQAGTVIRASCSNRKAQTNVSPICLQVPMESIGPVDLCGERDAAVRLRCPSSIPYLQRGLF